MALTPWLGTSDQAITQGYGVCELAGDCPHTGIDVAAAAGTPILAQLAGVVRDVVNQGGFGLEQILDLGAGREIILGHESGFAVPSGTRVAPGEVIGYVGASGFATGPHLHFQEDVGGRPVDPSALLFSPGASLLSLPGNLGPAVGAVIGAAGQAGGAAAGAAGGLAGAVEQGVLQAAADLAGGVGSGIGAGLGAAAGTVGHGLANAAAGSLQDLQTFAARNLVALVVAAVVVVVLFL